MGISDYLEPLFDGDKTHHDGTNECLRPVAHVEFLEDGGEVVLGRLLADEEARRDVAVGGALSEQLEHFELALGQRPWTPLFVI